MIFKYCATKNDLLIKIQQLENFISQLDTNYILLKKLQSKCKLNTSKYNEINQKIEAQLMQIHQFKRELKENYEAYDKQLF